MIKRCIPQPSMKPKIIGTRIKLKISPKVGIYEKVTMAIKDNKGLISISDALLQEPHKAKVKLRFHK